MVLVDFAGTGGGGGGFIPSFTIFGGVNLASSTFGGAKGLPFFVIIGGGGGGGTRCAFLVLVTVTGIASAPFSTMGLDGAIFLCCARLKMPIPNRQKRSKVSFSFINLVLIEILNVIKSIKCAQIINTHRAIAEEQLVLTDVDDL